MPLNNRMVCIHLPCPHTLHQSSTIAAALDQDTDFLFNSRFQSKLPTSTKQLRIQLESRKTQFSDGHSI